MQLVRHWCDLRIVARGIGFSGLLYSTINYLTVMYCLYQKKWPGSQYFSPNTMCMFFIFIGSASLFVSTSLLQGIQKSESSLLLPWLITAGILLTIMTIMSLFGFIFAIYNGYGVMALLIFTLYVILISFGTYLFFVVYTLYVKYKSIY